MRTLCLDVGSHRVGVAVTDAAGITAQPLEVVERKRDEDAVSAIVALVQRYEADAIVVGLPLTLDGREASAVRRIRRFTAMLEARISCPIVEWDERLSTMAAERALAEGGMSTRERRHVVDSVAASLILQSYMGMRPRNT